MPESRTRVLVVNPKLHQAVGIKNALEALGGFEARPFTSSLNALEFARTTPPDAAVLDIAIRSPNIGETTVALRKLNPKIKLLLTNAPEEALTKLRADGQISLPARAREAEPLLRALFPPPVSENRPPTPIQRPGEAPKAAPEDASPPADASQPDPFQRIAAEEPPIPTVLEGGTVREAVRALLPRQPLDESMYVVEITPIPSDTDEGQPVDDAAQLAGEAQEPPPVRVAVPPAAEPPRPREVDAPPFDDLDSDLDEPPAAASAAPVPRPAPKPRLAPVPAPVEAEPIPAVPEPPADGEAKEQSAQPAPEVKIPGQRRPVKKRAEGDAPAQPAAPPAPHAEPVQAPARKAATESREHAPPSPADLKRALMLTYEQLGTAAAALILTQGDEVLAHSGEMPTQEIEELQSVIDGDWDTKGTQSRIRYIMLPTTQQEYMLHTRRTDNGYALSMAFAGDVALRDIREQSDAVAMTLETMSIADLEEAQADTRLTVARLPFTAVWMLNDPDDPLTADIAQAVVIEFDRELRELGWTIHTMNVHADFVYIFCDVQTTYLASEVVAELKRISAEAACARRPDWSPDELWADAYLALVPGRELGSDEVESFLTFTRARLHRKVE